MTLKSDPLILHKIVVKHWKGSSNVFRFHGLPQGCAGAPPPPGSASVLSDNECTVYGCMYNNCWTDCGLCSGRRSTCVWPQPCRGGVVRPPPGAGVQGHRPTQQLEPPLSLSLPLLA